MSKTIKTLLFTVLAIAFSSNFLATNAILDVTNGLYSVNLFDFAFTIPDRLYNIANIISGTLNYAALLVIIQVINVTNKKAEITQGTLDNKQNVSLANQALIMEAQVMSLGSNNFVDIEERNAIVENLKLRIPLTTKLSNTHIDFKSINIESQIISQESILESLKLALETSIKSGNITQQKMLNTAITEATKFLNSLIKKRV